MILQQYNRIGHKDSVYSHAYFQCELLGFRALKHKIRIYCMGIGFQYAWFLCVFSDRMALGLSIHIRRIYIFFSAKMVELERFQTFLKNHFINSVKNVPPTRLFLLGKTISPLKGQCRYFDQGVQR